MMQEVKVVDNIHKTKQLVDEFFSIFEALQRVHRCQYVSIQVLNWRYHRCLSTQVNNNQSASIPVSITTNQLSDLSQHSYSDHKFLDFSSGMQQQPMWQSLTLAIGNGDCITGRFI